MDILQAFVLNGIEHKVNILWDEDQPLFRATEIASVLDIKNIHTSIIKFKERHKVLLTMDTLGGPQEVTFLTEQGLYKLLMLSRKPIAEPFQEWVEDIIVSIRKKGKYELELQKQTIEQAIKKEAEKYIVSNDQANHNALVSAFKDKYVVYFGKIKTIEDKILIKIGSTQNVTQRAKDLVKDFGSISFFKMIECPLHETFEHFLHKHPHIKPFAYKEIIYEERRSTEAFLVTQEEINKILDVANRNLIRFTNQVTALNIIELEKIKLQQIEAKNETLRITNEIIDESDDDIIDNEAYYYENGIVANHRNHTQARGPKIQIYNPDGTLVQTYDSLIEPTREHDFLPDASRNMIMSAIKNNTVYKRFRWMRLDRALPDDTVQILPATVDSIPIQKGLVAMLNLEKTRIEQVFCDQKAAAENRNFKGQADA